MDVETKISLPDGTVVESARVAAAPMVDEVPVEEEMGGPGGGLEERIASLEQRLMAVEEMLSASVSAQVAALVDAETPLPSLG